MYIPTNEELEEMGFTVYPEQGVHLKRIGRFVIECDLPFWNVYLGEDNTTIYPQSKEDILTLIRLFSNS